MPTWLCVVLSRRVPWSRATPRRRRGRRAVPVGTGPRRSGSSPYPRVLGRVARPAGVRPRRGQDRIAGAGVRGGAGAAVGATWCARPVPDRPCLVPGRRLQPAARSGGAVGRGGAEQRAGGTQTPGTHAVRRGQVRRRPGRRRHQAQQDPRGVRLRGVRGPRPTRHRGRLPEARARPGPQTPPAAAAGTHRRGRRDPPAAPGPSYTPRRLVALRDPDLDLFTGQEIALVDRVIDRCRGRNASTLSRISQEADGWRAVAIGDDIPYSTAYWSEHDLTTDDIDRARELAAAER